jgi:hypothetical protein
MSDLPPSTSDGRGEHTPGPWFTIERLERADDGGAGCVEIGPWDPSEDLHRDSFYEDTLAEVWDGNYPAVENARLMAAAPDLLEAARAVVERWDSPLWKDAEPTAHVILKLRQAIKKAVEPLPPEEETETGR